MQVNNRKIAKNTIFLYFRMLITMGVTLFTSRVILQTLGFEDYGIYNVVGGIVATFSFISGSLTAASQRFITFELGKGINGNLSKVFSMCLILHILLALIIILIAEPIGLWFIYNKMMIPESRLYAAEWVFHFSVMAMAILFISVPYNGLIIAYEKMNAFAIVSIIDALLRLGIAYSLLIFNDLDKLVIYGFLIMISQVLICSCYICYSKRNFLDVKFDKKIDRTLLVDMGQFASWSIFGNLAFMTYTQGLNLLLGSFFNPVVSAARGIAVQVQGAVKSFVSNFQTAVNPQITKSYASGNISEMITLIFRSSRFSFYLLMILSIPVLLRTEDILSLWLVKVPEYSVLFLRLILLTTLLNSIAGPLNITVKATGNIKRYEFTVEGFMLLILPVSYVFMRLGYNPETVFIVHLIFEIFAMVLRVYIVRSLIHFSIRDYIGNVLCKILLVLTVSSVIPYFISEQLALGVISFFIVLVVSIITSLFAIILFGLDNDEKCFLIKKMKCIARTF